MVIGVVLYFVYGRSHSRLRRGDVVAPDAEDRQGSRVNRHGNGLRTPSYQFNSASRATSERPIH